MSTQVIASDLPQFLLDMIASPPRAGEGVHQFPFKVARHLHYHRQPEDIFALIKAVLEDCGRPVPDREIWDAINNSKDCAWHPNKDGGPVAPAQPAWPVPNLEAIDAVVRGGYGVEDIIEQSPIRFEGPESHTEEIIDVLFPGNPLLCCGKADYLFATRRREAWRKRGLASLPLLVPNPMLSVWGKTGDGKGKWSQHTKQATARKVYQVIEFDFSEKDRSGKKDTKVAPLVRAWKADGIAITDACAALILHLKQMLPTLAVVCYSGGKSVHAWFLVFSMDPKAQREFMNYAMKHGADDATYCKSQFVRIPDGLRDTGVRQTAYYLDPREAVKA
jgi:hypothetical protein